MPITVRIAVHTASIAIEDTDCLDEELGSGYFEVALVAGEETGKRHQDCARSSNNSLLNEHRC